MRSGLKYKPPANPLKKNEDSNKEQNKHKNGELVTGMKSENQKYKERVGIDKALADLEASISLMPNSMFVRLELVLDMEEDFRIPIILGRPFLATAHAIIDEKCHFMVMEGKVLGHKISSAGIEVDKAKLNVAKLPYPTNIKGIRSFLGHVRFYRRFIKDFSKIARPMTQLLMKDTKFVFSDDCIQAFNVLKKKLTTTPVIIAPNWNLDFKLMCDASDYVVGEVLG
ncbi:reverse transcriptase domain-containing protein [Tanacetum coccineum]|uniref:Reverse transcriptase domain-containing protein n=1 Tax=Tanacetum coccineum TaxID=301880 RepID=A0ABQ5GF25_9ASTR